jgi:tetratricopeptide (TPR) repeat protein
MSRTYVAQEVALGRKVVVKILPPDLAAGVSIDRFKREIQLAATLQHPHIVPVLSAGDFDGLPWFTMPYVEGESLRARLGRGPIGIVEATGILKDIARALEFAHSRGVVHRDIKPDNVLLAGSSATVTDFGIAKALTVSRAAVPGSTLTAAGTSVGTPMYMAPEQAAGDPTLDYRSDIYSFGVVAYELLAGHAPFTGPTPAKIVAAHFSEAPRDIRDVRPDTPAALGDLVMQCLEKDVAKRPQSASDILRLLDAVPSGQHATRRTFGVGKALVGAAVLLVVAVVVMRATGVLPGRSLIAAGKLAQKERLIITDFKGPASDSLLGITVTEALRADLAESPALRIVPRRALNQTLRLMTLPPTTPIDFDVARQLATRDGVKAVLDGNVVALGGRYVVSTRLVSATTGEELASFRQEASSQNDLIPAIGRLAKQLRAKVGESLETVRESKPLERVTTSSIEALSKYAEAQAVYDRTSDYSRSIPLLEQAVAIDSTFAMAWRRLSANLAAVGRRERGVEAAANAYKYRDHLGDIERDLTTAAYFQNGPATDDERALAAFESVLARDSTNNIALNNSAIILGKRREFERAAELQLRAAAQDSGTPTPIVWTNAIGSLVSAGHIGVADSLLGVWAQRTPGHPNLLLNEARVAASHRDYDKAETLYRDAIPKVAGSVSVTESVLGEFGQILLMRGRVREGLRMQAEVSARQIKRGERIGILLAGIDSMSAAVFIEEKPEAAREQLRRVLRRMPPDSFPLLNRPNLLLLSIAAFAGDVPVAEALRADFQKQLVALGKTIDRSGSEAFADGLVAFSRGRYAEALERFADTERTLHWCTYCVTGLRFIGYDRLGRADSAIAMGEAYLKLTQAGIITAQIDARFRAGIIQRLAELYEGKGMTEKAVANYEIFLNLWKNADPELQAQVRDVRGRVARLRASEGRR